MRFKSILTVILTLSFLFAFSLVAISQDDPDTIAPPGEDDGYYSETEPSESYVTRERIGNAPGMDDYCWYNEDFGWTHTFDACCKDIQKVKLKIRAWDVDAEWGEVDKVYADGVYLGDLEGTSGEWSITVFEVDPGLLSDGQLNVCLDIDVTHDYPNWAVTIDWSKLRVKWEWLPPVVDFDSKVNIGVGELYVNFKNLSECYTRVIWEFDDGDSVSDLDEPLRIFQPGSYDISLSVWGHEPWFGVPDLIREDFAVVYDPDNAPVELEIVDCSEAYKHEPWSNVIDKDFWYWNGTTSAVADSPAYCKFIFADSAVHTIDKIRLVIDTGVDYEYAMLTDFELMTATDLTNYKTVKFADTLETGRWVTYIFEEPVKTKYVFLNLLAPMKEPWIILGEFEVWEMGKAPPAIQLAKRPGIKTVEVAESTSPANFVLSQNYPNPFNPKTDINYQIPDELHVKVKIYNMRGEEVRTLVDGKRYAGTHSVTWDGHDNSGNKVSSGVYIYRLNAGKYTATKKMAMLK